MKKILLISLYILLFWLVLPSALIFSSLALDRHFHAAHSFSLVSRVLGSALALISALLLALSIVQFFRFSRKLPVSALPPDRIIQSGLYALVRHPIYLFYTMLFIGIGIAIGSRAMLAVVLPAFAALELLYVYIEEAILVRRHGDSYRYYRSRTGFVVPRFYQWMRIPVMALCKIFFSYRILHKERIPAQPPFFIVAAHRNYLDPFMIATAVGFPVYFVTTFEVFRSRWSRLFFRACFCIPRKRYLNDIAAGRRTMRLAKQGAVIGIFPEGERAWTNAMLPFKPEALKLLRKCSHIPVLPVRLEGNYHAWPRWAAAIRRARVTVTIEKPLSLDPSWDLERIGRELSQRIMPAGLPVTCCSRNRAKGLAKILYRCPCCRALSKMVCHDGRQLQCAACSTLFDFTPRYDLKYQQAGESRTVSLDEAYRMIRITGSDMGQPPNAAAPEICRSGAVSCFVENGTRFVPGGMGPLVLTNKALAFAADAGGTPCEVPLQAIRSVTIESNCRLQVYDGVNATLHQFIFTQDSALLWQDAIAAAAERFCNASPNAR